MDFIRHALGSKECLVAEIDGELAASPSGIVGFTHGLSCGCWACTRRFRGRGAAAALIAHVETLNEQRGLYTSTNESNVPMQRLLEKRGFVQTAGSRDSIPVIPRSSISSPRSAKAKERSSASSGLLSFFARSRCYSMTIVPFD